MESRLPLPRRMIVAMTTHPVAIMAMAQATRTVRVAQISGTSQQHGGHYNNYKLLRESCTEHTFCLDIE